MTFIVHAFDAVVPRILKAYIQFFKTCFHEFRLYVQSQAVRSKYTCLLSSSYGLVV